MILKILSHSLGVNPKKILIVDDAKDNRTMLCELLMSQRKVILAKDGAQGLALATKTFARFNFTRCYDARNYRSSSDPFVKKAMNQRCIFRLFSSHQKFLLTMKNMVSIWALLIIFQSHFIRLLCKLE